MRREEGPRGLSATIESGLLERLQAQADMRRRAGVELGGVEGVEVRGRA